MIDINKASKKELTDVPGIGATKAGNIISYRKKNGKFNDISEVMNVKGIGEAYFERIKEYITVENRDRIEYTFKPFEYGLPQLQEVHLVGEMNDWDPADLSYRLTKVEKGIWKGTFILKKGTEYKIMYDSQSWEENKHIGDYDGSNLVIE